MKRQRNPSEFNTGLPFCFGRFNIFGHLNANEDSGMFLKLHFGWMKPNGAFSSWNYRFRDRLFLGFILQ